MKPRAIFFTWIAATIVSLTGVFLFTSKIAPPTVSRLIMGLGIVLSLTWIIGLISLIVKKLFRSAK